MKLISTTCLHILLYSFIVIAIASINNIYASEDEPVDISNKAQSTSQLAVQSAPVLDQADNGELTEVIAEEAVLSDQENIDLLDGEVIEAEGKQALVLLNSTVEPGEAALLKWSLEATFEDNSTPVPVLVVNGANPGPVLCLTAAVHGDELNGIEIVRRVVYEVDAETLSGSVIGIPIVNMQGFRRVSRYLPDRRDLNRYFPGRVNGSYASRIAHSFFTNVVQHCDYLIDIHTGSLSRTNLPQIRANLLLPEVASLAEKMGSIVVLQSKGSVGTLRRASVEAGIPAVTLEAGAPNNLQKDAVEEGVASILSAMSSLGLAPKKFWRRNKEPVFYKSTWIRAQQGGILFSKVELGDSVEKDGVLGLLSDPISNKTTEIIAPIDGRVIGMALNQVMYPGFAAYHIGLKSSAVEAANPDELIPDEEIDLAKSEIDEEVIADPEQDLSNDESVPSISDTEKQPIEEMELPTIDNE